MAVENKIRSELFYQLKAKVKAKAAAEEVTILATMVIDASHCEGVAREEHPKAPALDKQTAVQVTVDGATKMFFLPTTRRGGKTRPDPKLLSAAKRLKPADLVQIKPRPGGKRLLAVRITKLKKKKDDE